MQTKNFKIVLLNALTTLIVLLLPFLDLKKINDFVSEGAANPVSTPFLAAGILFNSIVSIFIVFNIIKVIFVFCKIDIEKHILYGVFITSKLLITLTNSFLLNVQMSIYLMIIREMIFGIIFCVLIYFYLDSFNKINNKKFTKMTILTMFLLFTLSLMNSLVLFR